ncbi:MAG: hypothetical protein LBD68_05845, partial [Zoogloeaceae bacterium]|nr:hypothetical protein [Zoogloeaceae bacterium]
MRRLFRPFLWLLFALYLGFSALTLALRFWVMPELPRYQPEIEALASRVLGTNLSLGRLEARWSGLNPGVSLHDVRIFNAEGEVALRLTRVDGVLSWRSLLSLWRGMPTFTLLSLEKPELLIQRDREGKLFVAGLPIPAREEDGENGAALQWLLAQQRIRIHDARIVWRDDLHAAPPLALQSASLEWRNRGRRHRFGLTARPPAHLAAALDVRGELSDDTADTANWRTWRGQIYTRLEAANLPEILPLLKQNGLDAAGLQIERGRGALRLWAQRGERGWQGTGDVALADARLRLGADLPMLEVSRLQGRLQAARSAASGLVSWRVASRKLTLEARLPQGDAIGIAGLNMNSEWRARVKNAETGLVKTASPNGEEPFPSLRAVSISLNALDLAQLARLSEALPLPEKTRALLDRHQPQGMLRQVKAHWNQDISLGREARKDDYGVEAAFERLAFRAADKMPGVAGLSGKIVANAAEGKLTLEGRQAALSFPVVFAEPQFLLDRLRAQVEWRRNAKGIKVEVRSLDLV